MRPRLVVFALIAVVAVAAAACGSPGESSTNAGGGSRTIDIDMRDTAFSPKHITVPAGQEVRLVFHNRGKVAHDAFVGDEQAQMDHERAMSSSSSSMGDMHHGDSDALTVQPGDSGMLTHTFRAGDEVLIGCHQPGHYASGMKVTVKAG